ncbi:glycoside hydrolase family 61 protein [Rhodotorula graminis WP1]|uniref:AA9 family lytic polysaccharide monooxygenase n=1 Tax=Rhodotorula graminis (strain WP1) TaxID=578459 RepID=A0A194S9S9_RHOGW|nr:glycoside hydrolase family 61 protein [Rhodotorula graminis WP1]KPV77357.1 glycoside hydrolase family 61 protein [Rhodotorula graminis WP1]
MVAKLAALAVALVATASSVSAHTIVTSVWVNGKDTATGGVGVAAPYMRGSTSNSPVQEVNSALMACNDKGATPAASTLSVAAGDVIEPEWYHSGARGADPIDPSHKGPITAWIAPYGDNANSLGAKWVEIASEAYYPSSSEWAVSHMIANKGRNKVTIPKSLAPGKYIVRFELLALHSAGQAGGAQFYPQCADIEITSGGTTKLPAGVSIPGFYSEQTPGVVWIYYSSSYDVTGDYVAPGTGTWDGTSAYSTDRCHEVVSGLAPTGYCQDGASPAPAPSTSASKAPVTTSKAPATSAAASSSKPVATSAPPASSKPAAPSSSTKPVVTSAIKTTTTAAASTRPATSSQAASTSASAPPAAYTDYNSCMRAMNVCKDGKNAAAAKTGGSVDFSSCDAMQCASLQTKRIRRSHRAASHRA